MQARVKWVEDVTFVTESGSGHTVVVDGAPEYGGRNIGPRPMELLLMGLGGCTAFDVVTILKKARQDITSVEAKLSAERADAVPAVFTRIHVHFVVKGKDLKDIQVKKAIDLSADKYCSASIMLGQAGVEITHDYEIVADA
jgi:putative redox protein